MSSLIKPSAPQCARIGRCAGVWAAAIMHGAAPSTSLDIHFLLRMLFTPHTVSDIESLRSMCASHCRVASGLHDADATVSLAATWHAVALAACVLSACLPIVMLVPQCARIPHQPSDRLLLALHQRASGNDALPVCVRTHAFFRVDSLRTSLSNTDSVCAFSCPGHFSTSSDTRERCHSESPQGLSCAYVIACG